jgi:hypothetical protein
MALLNGIYIHVTDEEVTRETKRSTHSVEEGIDITDTVKPQSTELSVKGKAVSYTEYAAEESRQTPDPIKAWISLCKKDGSKFETMTFDRLNNEILAFEDGVQWVNTGELQYLDDTLSPIDVSDGSSEVMYVKFEVCMPYGSTVRIQNAYVEWCCFNVINKSSTGYNIRDYSSDDEISDIVFSNTYNGQSGRVRTTFTNFDDPAADNPAAGIRRNADWVLKQLDLFCNTGALVRYEGRNLLENYQITSFTSSHPNTVNGGADIQLTLMQCRTGVNSYSGDFIANNSVQQISTGDNSEVWYTVQIGDSVYGLVAADDAPYKNLRRDPIDGVSYSAMEWVMRTNPSAFDVFGDYDTLQADVKILLGTR